MSVLSKSIFIGVFTVLASPVWASNMAQEVLEEFAAEMRQLGYVVTIGSKSETDGRLEWRDIVVRDPFSKFETRYPVLSAEETTPGTVRMIHPEKMTVYSLDENGNKALKVAITTHNFIDLVTGAADQRNHRYQADKINYGFQVPDTGFEADVSLYDLSSEIVVTGKSPRHYRGEAVSEGLEVTYKVGAEFEGVMHFSDARIQVDFDGYPESEAAKMIASDKPYLMQFDFAAGENVLKIAQKGFNGTLKTSSSASRYTLDIGKGVVKMGASAQNGQYELTFKDLPLPPLTASAQALAFDIAIPLQKQEAPLQAGMVLRVQDLVASDSLWGMVDAAGVLPREPANLVVDMSGGMKWLVDPMKTEAVKQSKGQTAEVFDVALKQLLLDFADARLSGQGKMEIDNSIEFKPGNGAFDFELIGGMGLMGKLVKMGLMEPQQRMMANVMAGLYTVPAGEGVDHLKSHIETKADGAIFVNGNQVK